jgi:hypothetical protein
MNLVQVQDDFDVGCMHLGSVKMRSDSASENKIWRKSELYTHSQTKGRQMLEKWINEIEI